MHILADSQAELKILLDFVSCLDNFSKLKFLLQTHSMEH